MSGSLATMRTMVELMTIMNMMMTSLVILKRIFRRMRSTLEKKLEVSAKSLEDQRRQKQRKLSR